MRSVGWWCGVFLALATLAAPACAEEIKVKGGTLNLEFASPVSPGLHGLALKWINDSARAVATYYGAFSVKDAVLRITPKSGHGASGGQAFGWNGPLIKMGLGRETTAADLSDDWMLTHEMLHLAFPSLAEKHHWLEEGLATYVEPIARCRDGQLTPERVWTDLVEGLPQGEPEAGDRGLDQTHTWGRTYWGGALFCLRADVEIRKRTGNRKGLDDSLRAIRAAGGTIESEWPIDRVIQTGDHETGVPVLQELYHEMKTRAVIVDLPALWKQLGVETHGHSVSFRQDAPLAAVRKAITGSR